jgi:hypothetical protein
MPSIDVGFLQRLQEDYSNFPIFVETGTKDGDTTLALEPIFDHLYTIELSDYFYQRAVSRYSGNKITFIRGDSGVELGFLLPAIKQNTVFFLDGHWSSGNTGRGQKDCPLIEEIEHIGKTFTPAAIIIIDDFRLFGQSPKTGLNEDWSDISKAHILSILGNRISHLYHLESDCAADDRLIIHLKPM